MLPPGFERHSKPRVSFQPGDSLINQGHRLARLYCHATAIDYSDAGLAQQRNLVRDGRPMVILDFEMRELKELPSQAHRVNSQVAKSAELAFAWLKTPAGTVGTWFIRRHSNNDTELRQLRRCLLRLHAEREILDLTISCLKRGIITYTPHTDAGDMLENYLNRATQLIQRDKLEGVSQPAVLEAFDAATDVMPAADLVGLAERLEGARSQIVRKIVNYEASRGASRVVTEIEVNYVQGDQVNIREIDRSIIGAFGRDSKAAVAIHPIIGSRDSNVDLESSRVTKKETNATQVSIAAPRSSIRERNSPMTEKKESRAGSINIDSISKTQIGAIGHSAEGTVFGVMSTDPSVAKSIKVAELQKALERLYEDLGQAGLKSKDLRIARRATDAALSEGIKDGEVEPETLVSRVKEVGDTLEAANKTVKEGTTLWEAVKNVADTVGPLVGGAEQGSRFFYDPLDCLHRGLVANPLALLLTNKGPKEPDFTLVAPRMTCPIMWSKHHESSTTSCVLSGALSRVKRNSSCCDWSSACSDMEDSCQSMTDASITSVGASRIAPV